MTQENTIIGRIRQISLSTPDVVALRGSKHITYEDLVRQIDRCADWLDRIDSLRIAVDLENSPAWAIVDLALLKSGKVSIPLPAFFSQNQREYLLQDAGVEMVITQSPEEYPYSTEPVPMEYGGETLYGVLLQNEERPVVQNTCKITYTSGTTGTPKGVCIQAKAMATVVESIVLRTQVTAEDRHLSLLPLTTLLENLGGLYVALTAGASVTLLSQQKLGIQGATGVEVSRFVEQLQQQQPTTTILVPQMVNLLVNIIESGFPLQHCLRFAAVGGAPISEWLLQRAAAIGLPIYEGYGLSEATSVATLNVPGETRIGTVGKPLPHVDLRIADDGEVWIKGSLFSGYLGEESAQRDDSGYLPTGDLGTVDDQGFLRLKGRKKNLLITAFGRNVAPEWVERELTIQPGIIQAALFGDGHPWNVVVVVIMDGADVTQAIEQANRTLPDYAKVRRWIVADEPFSTINGEWTGTARPRRKEIWARYGARIDALYQSESEVNE